MTHKQVFVTGVDTGVGKTLAAAVLAKAWQADYWKPIQCGSIEKSDSKIIEELLGQGHRGQIYPERYVLRLPQSPHLAAQAENLTLKLSDWTLPKTTNPLIVEGAGGCLVPLNQEDSMLDLARALDLPVILVTRFYLGCFNHTLLSIEAIQRRGLVIAGIILNGGAAPDFQEFIERKTGVTFIGVIPQLSFVCPSAIEDISRHWKSGSH